MPKTSVATTKLNAIVQKLGFEVKAKASSFKVWPKGGSFKRSLDISTNKHGNTVQVLLVGFTTDEGTKVLAKPPASTATHILDMEGKDEAIVLAAFMKICRILEATVAAAVVTEDAPHRQATDEVVEQEQVAQVG